MAHQKKIKMIDQYINQLEKVFEQHANQKIAQGQAAYMQYQFDFFGIQAPDRQTLQKPFLIKKYLPAKEDAFKIAGILWQKPQREFQYFAMTLVEKYKNQYSIDDIAFFEELITRKSWWDTVDFLSQKIIGHYFKIYPNKIQESIESWINSKNIWLQRTAILFQLKYKDQTDTHLLSHIIDQLKDTNTFFINKAIGWSLREYGKTNPAWTSDFVAQTKLHPLSRREAMRLINKNL